MIGTTWRARTYRPERSSLDSAFGDARDERGAPNRRAPNRRPRPVDGKDLGLGLRLSQLALRSSVWGRAAAASSASKRQLSIDFKVR